MSSAKPVACQLRKCVHYRGIVGPPEMPTHVCTAFPLGIPDSILNGNNLHLTSIQDDEGIVYRADRKVSPDWREGLKGK